MYRLSLAEVCQLLSRGRAPADNNVEPLTTQRLERKCFAFALSCHSSQTGSPCLFKTASDQERTDLTTKPSSERSDLAQRSLNSFSYFALRRDVCSPARRSIARCASSRTRNAICSCGSSLSATLATARLVERACIRGGACLQVFHAVRKRSSRKDAEDAQPFKVLGIRVVLQSCHVSSTSILDE
jgi:hypothetical protein